MITNPPPRNAITRLETATVLAIMAILAGLFLTTIKRIRTTANQIHIYNNMRRLGRATHAYHDHNDHTPYAIYHSSNITHFGFRIIPRKDVQGKSIVVRRGNAANRARVVDLNYAYYVLPFADHRHTIQQTFSISKTSLEYPRSYHAEYLRNATNLAVPVFVSPADFTIPIQPGGFWSYTINKEVHSWHFERIMRVRGRRLISQRVTRIMNWEQIQDGLSNTIMLGERLGFCRDAERTLEGYPRYWSATHKKAYLTFDRDTQIENVTTEVCQPDALHAVSDNITIILFADGTVRRVETMVDSGLLASMINPTG